MAGARITLIGEARPTTSATARARFLARHPAAAGYADFPDFSFYAFDITSAHFIGGFGRIVDLPRAQLLIDVAGAEALSEREADIVGHMNEDHADAIELYATRLLGARGRRLAHERHRPGRLRSRARRARLASAVRHAHHQRRGSAQGTRPPRRRSPRQSGLADRAVGTSPMKYIALIAVIAILLLQLSGAVPQSSVGGPMTLALVFFAAVLAVAIHEAWSNKRRVLGWIVNIPVSFVGAFVAAELGNLVFEPILLLFPVEGTLAASDIPCFTFRWPA